MNPVEGIFVPTFGACYLVETLLLPFVIIRLTGQDKQNGTLKLLLQTPLSPFALNGVKLAALGLVWLLVLTPGISVFIIWQRLGGALYLPEVLTLLLGHTLYSLTIICIAMFATAVSTSLPTAAMICLAATLGSWVLDFSGAGQGLPPLLASLSLTTLLRRFENGLLSATAVISFLALSLLFFIAASVLLHPGRKFFHKLKTLSLPVFIILIILSAAPRMPHSIDVSENQKHSFNPADVRAFKEMDKKLRIIVHLSPEDSRFYDLEHEVLARLRRVVPQLEIIIRESGSAGMFAAAEDDKYGLIEYEYNGRHDESYSNSPEEILPLLHGLAGHKVSPDKMPEYAGHPLVADASGAGWWFYLLLPLLFLLGGCLGRRPQFSTWRQ